MEDFFQRIGWSCALFYLSVHLFVCQLPTNHNFKPIFTKLHQMVEFVINKKPLDFEVKRSTQAKDQLLSISKIVNFHLNDLKFEHDFHIGSLNSTTNYF